MLPRLSGIDHVHVYVEDWARAEAWYGKVLGMRRVEALMQWAVPGGPLTLEDASGSVHLALFEDPGREPGTAIAFRADGEAFLRWVAHLEKCGLKLRIADHELAYSVYFRDPDDNMHEITTYDHELVRPRLAPRRD